MKLKLVTAPTDEPVTSSEARVHLRIVGTDNIISQVDNETPSPAPNGVVKAFELDYDIADDTYPIVILNGFVQTKDVHYTYLGDTITFVLPPLTGDAIRVWYRTEHQTDVTSYTVQIDNEEPTPAPDGVETDFVLAEMPLSPTNPLVTINSAVQVEGVDYTIDGDTITFTLPPAVTDEIRVWYWTAPEVEEVRDDTYILNCIAVAREFCEEYQNRAYLTQTWDLTLDEFPDDTEIELPRPPLQSVTSITYTDTAGASRTLSTSVYGVDTQSEPGRIYLKYGQSWPDTYRQANSVVIRFKAGHTATALIPKRIKQAILLYTAHMYENRGGVSTFAHSQVPLGIEALLTLDRMVPL